MLAVIYHLGVNILFISRLENILPIAATWRVVNYFSNETLCGIRCIITHVALVKKNEMKKRANRTEKKIL